jgi:ABC-type sugar transport system permease subunit
VVSLNLINGLKVFDLIYAMTSGGPGNASQSLGVYLYQLAFGSENGGSPAFGYADAIGVVMMFAAALLFLAVNILRRERLA